MLKYKYKELVSLLRFYYNPFFKYTNRTIINLLQETSYKDIDYENIDSHDTINGHIIYSLAVGETLPTYILDLEKGWRWYVSGITQLRSGKFQISLLRDVISESDDWKYESAYIYAGTATDYCKYKTWDLPFTNTKVNSQRLNINGKSSFFVFYVNEQEIDNSNVLTEKDWKVSYSQTWSTLPHADLVYDTLSEFPYYSYLNQNIYNYENSSFSFYYRPYDYPNDVRLYMYPSGFYGPTLFTTNYIKINAYDEDITDTDYNEYLITALGNASSTFYSTRNMLDGYIVINKSDMDNMVAYDGQVISVKSTLDPTKRDYYRIHNTHVGSMELLDPYEIPKSDVITTQFINEVKLTIPSFNINDVVGDSFLKATTYAREAYFTLDYLGSFSDSAFSFNFTADFPKLTKSSVRCVNMVADSDTSDEEIFTCLQLARANPNNENALSRIIDIQYLPFSIATDKNANFSIGGNQLTAAPVLNDDWQFTTTMANLTNISKETDSIMIVSPSRKSQFKFSPYNNDGRMVFNTKITLRPNQSVIYVRPSTQGLLMYDWDDKDCLIIQEDFSLTAIDSDWTNYVYNNRNYQNAFNLQIQTKEIERSWERRIEQAQAKSDVWTAMGISADRARNVSGNIPIISGITAAIYSTNNPDQNYMDAAALDRQYNEAMYQRGLEVARTNFEYQIDNIKSRPLIPNTITTIDTKMLDGVYLEFYSTNSTELSSIQRFYENNGNRIDNYGTFITYWGDFIRGKIIRSVKYTQPEIDELNRRLQMGIYTKGVNE